MKSLTLVVIFGSLAFLGNINAASVSTESSENVANFGEALKMYNEAVLKIMPCGYEPDHIPKLAPFTLEHVPYNITNDDLKLLAELSNLIFSGLNNLEFIDLSFDEDTNRLSFDLMYPQLQLVAEYDIDLWARVAGYPYQYEGDGILNWKLTDLRFVGEYIIKDNPSIENHVQLSDLKMNFYIGDIVANNWNNKWDISLNNFINRMLPSYLNIQVQQIQNSMDEIASKYLTPRFNELLSNYTMDELIKFFVDQAQAMNKASCELA